MSNLPALASSAAIGCGAGVVFFGGLWWTVRQGVRSSVPALWFAGSLAVRLPVTLVAFYFASQGDWAGLLACVLGFIAARLGIVRASRLGALDARREAATP